MKRVEGLRGQLEESQRAVSSYRSAWVASKLREAGERSEVVERARLYTIIDPVEVEGGREVLRILSGRPGYVAALVSRSREESLFEIAVSEDLRGSVNANGVVQDLVRTMGGGGLPRNCQAEVEA